MPSQYVLRLSCDSQAKEYGPTISGMLFGCGWWIWIDAVLCVSGHKPSAVQVRLKCSKFEREVVSLQWLPSDVDQTYM